MDHKDITENNRHDEVYYGISEQTFQKDALSITVCRLPNCTESQVWNYLHSHLPKKLKVQAVHESLD